MLRSERLTKMLKILPKAPKTEAADLDGKVEDAGKQKEIKSVLTLS